MQNSVGRRALLVLAYDAGVIEFVVWKAMRVAREYVAPVSLQSKLVAVGDGDAGHDKRRNDCR
jgi:hypothetical protein